MKIMAKILTATLLTTFFLTRPLFAQLTILSDGSDGALNITSNTVIDLSLAVTRDWNDNNTNNAGKGIYDSNKWAVVFKYSSVTIASNATVTFANHPSRAPVVWLVSSNVTVNGTVSLDGQSYAIVPNLAEPGPGGFRGGSGFFSTGVAQGAGFGVGGASRVPDGSWGYGGSYATVGYAGPASYGNPSVLPLIGGSGGSGAHNSTGGGAGAGAILIAVANTLTINGSVRANGGAPAASNGGGSGGGIRLVGHILAGNGIVQCLGGGNNGGGLGRIRIERVTNSGSSQVTPDPSVVTLQAGSTPLIWLPTDGPTARIISIGAVNSPGDPRASFGTYGPDVTLPQVSTTPVIIETTNAETASTVKVRVTPRANGNYTETTATLTATNSTSPLVLRWTANVPVNNGYSAVQVKVVRP